MEAIRKNKRTFNLTALKLSLLTALISATMTVAFSQTKEINYPVKKEVKWFTDARFGMFIHWTALGAIDEEIGWSWGNSVSKEKYMQLCKEWNPVKFNADEWVSIAKNVGMKYIVFVPKHHDGFCLWDTKATDFNIMNTPYGKDICKQLSEACKQQGIAFCTYYSIADLHENGWAKMRGVFDKNFEPVQGGMDSYFQFVKQQCAELIQKYHTQNFWFDGFWHTEWYDHPKYRNELYAYIKSLNANVIMSRLQMPTMPKGGDWDDGWDFEKNVGDYHSREDHGNFGWEKLYYKGPWEFCSSVAYPNYSYNSKMKFKTSKEMIQTLVKIAGRNGNYLLDMAPKPDGSVDDTQKKLFLEMGDWLKKNGESIYGTEGGPFLPVNSDFVSTRKGNKIYLHLMNGQSDISLPAFKNKIKSAKIFGTAQKVDFEKTNNKFLFKVLPGYKNDTDVIIELTVKGSATGMELINSLSN